MLVVGLDKQLYLPMGQMTTLNAVKNKLSGYRHCTIDDLRLGSSLDEFIQDSSQVIVYKMPWEAYALKEGDYVLIHAVLYAPDVALEGGIKVGVSKQKVFDYYKIKESPDMINVLQCASGLSAAFVKYEFDGDVVSRIVYSFTTIDYDKLSKIGRLQSPQKLEEYDLDAITTYSYYKEYE